MEKKQMECRLCCKEITDDHFYDCEDCYNVICTLCFDEEYYEFNDWLNVSVYCTQCDKIICSDCVFFCYDCMNQDDADWYCEDCCPKDIVPVKCKFHTCTTFAKSHELLNYSGECGTCKSNRNYDLKHSV